MKEFAFHTKKSLTTLGAAVLKIKTSVICIRQKGIASFLDIFVLFLLGKDAEQIFSQSR